MAGGLTDLHLAYPRRMPVGGTASLRPRTVLVAHPNAELYGSDRVMLETVAAFRERGWSVEVSLPCVGPLVEELQGRAAHMCGCARARRSARAT